MQKGARYAVATAEGKAVEVYEKLVVRVLSPSFVFAILVCVFLCLLRPRRAQKEAPDDPPSLVIAADTVVTTRSRGGTEEVSILEKPETKSESLRMLLELTDGEGRCEVISGVVVGELDLRRARPRRIG